MYVPWLWRREDTFLRLHVIWPSQFCGVTRTMCNVMHIFTDRKLRIQEVKSLVQENTAGGGGVRRFICKVLSIKYYKNGSNYRMILAYLCTWRQKVKLHIEWCFSLCWIRHAYQHFGALHLQTPSSFSHSRGDTPSLFPNSRQLSWLRCTVLRPELFQTGCHWVLNREQQDTQLPSWRGSLETQVWRIMALRNGVWHNQLSFRLTSCGRKTVLNNYAACEHSM